MGRRAEFPVFPVHPGIFAIFSVRRPIGVEKAQGYPALTSEFPLQT
jgi:hypothetical protein